MRLSQESLEKLSQIVCGDVKFTPYLSGPELTKLFNNYGFDDEYIWGGSGLPVGGSRVNYTLIRLGELNGTKQLGDIISEVVSKRHFVGTKFDANITESVDTAITMINAIIEYDGYHFEKANDIFVLIGAEIDNAPISVDAHFQDIRNQIIEQIRQAKYMIWVAVAWFTDNVLFNELLKKKAEGLSIYLIIADIKENTKLPYQKYFPTIRVKKDTYYGKKIESLDGVNAYEDLMHNKFCIIDLKTVIEGSYNWTTKAEFNDETITIIKGREVAEKFADKYINLKIQSVKKPK